MTKYRAMLISIDQDDQAYVFDCESDTVQGVWDQVNDMGSRWIFYPIPIITRIHNGRWPNFKYSKVIDTCIGLEWAKGMTISKLLEYMKHNDMSYLLS